MTATCRTAIEARLTDLLREILEDPSLAIDPSASLIDDYGIDSLDLLDFSFNIEEIYQVKIGRDELAVRAGRNLDPDALLTEDGCLSEDALAELRRSVPEIPAAKIVSGLRQGDIPRLLNVAVFARIVHSKLTGEAA